MHMSPRALRISLNVLILNAQGGDQGLSLSGHTLATIHAFLKVPFLSTMAMKT
jgi:hypothetical protein